MDALPIQYIYQFTPEVQLVLYDDLCDKEQIDIGWRAQALNNVAKRSATGCWHMGLNGSIVMYLEDDQNHGVFFDLNVYKDKFKPVYSE